MAITNALEAMKKVEALNTQVREMNEAINVLNDEGHIGQPVTFLKGKRDELETERNIITNRLAKTNFNV